MTQFRSRRKGGVQVELPAHAAALLANLARQLVELLSDGEASHPVTADPLEALLDFDAPREEPQDPALLRLLPTGHRDDDEAAAEFRRFTERSLRDAKIADALTVIDTIGELPDEDPDPAAAADDFGGAAAAAPSVDADAPDVEFELDANGARAWLRSLTDMRLTLAERLGVTAEDETLWESVPADDPRLPVYEIYGWLAYMLESLLDAVRH